MIALLISVLCVPTMGCARKSESIGPSATGERLEEGGKAVGYKGPKITVSTVPGDYKVASSGYEAYRRNGFQPRNDVKPIKLDIPINWAMDPFDDSNWRFQLEAWRMLNPLWGQYRKRRDTRIIREILDMMRDWDQFHLVDGRRASYAWQDMATGLRAQHIAYMFHLAATGEVALGRGDREALERMADAHVSKLRDPQFFSLNNHGIFQIHGLRLLCNEASWVHRCAGEEAYSAKRMGELIEQQFDAYGVHSEDSPFYHVFAYKTFKGIRPQLYPSMDSDTRIRINRAEEISPWFSSPAGDIVAVGDSEGKGVPFPSTFKPHCVAMTERRDCIMVGDFVRSGYAVVRTGPATPLDQASMLFVSGSSHDAGHDHADELSFVLYERGIPLIVDGGKYGYKDDAWRRYFVSDAAHNVAGLEGVSFPPEATTREGSSLTQMVQQNGSVVIEGNVQRAPTFQNWRRFTYELGKQLELEDRIDAPSGARAELRFHIAPGLSVSRRGNDAEVSDQKRRLATIKLVSGRCHTVVARGEKEPGLQGWFSPSYLAVEPINTVMIRCEPGENRITTRIQSH